VGGGGGWGGEGGGVCGRGVLTVCGGMIDLGGDVHKCRRGANALGGGVGGNRGWVHTGRGGGGVGRHNHLDLNGRILAQTRFDSQRKKKFTTSSLRKKKEKNTLPTSPKIETTHGKD